MKLLTLLLPTLILAQQQPLPARKPHQGFNSGATLTSQTPKVLADFEQEFRTAQALHFSPGTFSSARLYTNIQASTTDTPITAFQAAVNTNTSLLLGIWCSGLSARGIEDEIAALKKGVENLGKAFTDLVVGLSVGSEDMYRISESGVENNAGVGVGPSSIVSFVKEVRSALAGTALASVPIGHVDSWSAWTNSSNSDVVEEVDFVGMDLYPYYERDVGNEIGNASAVFDDLWNRTIAAANGKPVWVTETGWPTSGPVVNQAVPNEVNAKAYWDAVACRLVGRVDIWWYNLRDSNSAIEEKFGVSKDLTADTSFNLTCPANSGAPVAVNTDLSKGVKKSGSFPHAVPGYIFAVVSLIAMGWLM